jgi:tagatose 6-phosphate kinase
VIVVVCLNPALDITYYVPAMKWAEVNRPTEVYARPGGKGLNVARVLHSLAADVLLLGFAGGVTGAGVREAIGQLGVPAVLTRIADETRRTFTVVDAAGDATVFNEPGPVVSQSEFAEFLGEYGNAVAGAAAVVLSGSLPQGLATGTYATLVETAAAAGVPAVLDAHGEALLRGAAAGPAIVKPNLEELENLVGRRLSSPHGPDRAAVGAATARLQAIGAQAVVASLGPDGLLAATGDGRWHARPGSAVAGNATGAGDAVAAALAHGLVLGRPWDERLRHAAALGAASVAAPVAGEFSHSDYVSALSGVTVHQDEAHQDEVH